MGSDLNKISSAGLAEAVKPRYAAPAAAELLFLFDVYSFVIIKLKTHSSFQSLIIKYSCSTLFRYFNQATRAKILDL